MSLRTGQQYLDALRDGRRVWLRGERVDSVPDQPEFRGCLSSLARLYDAQHDPETREVFTLPGEDGEPTSLAWNIPRTAEDLVRRRRMVETFSRWYGGVSGRLQDYLPVVLWGLLDAVPMLRREHPRWAENLERYYDFCRQGDLCLSHSFADPQLDRSKPSGELERLRIIEQRTDGGLRVSGAKTVATLAPFADEYLVLTPPRRGLVPEQALFFAVPVDSPGLRLVCRRPFAGSSSSGPLARQVDEMDAWAVFEDVEVPADRVFLAGDMGALRMAWRHLTVWTHYHLLTRMAVKAETFLGVCGLVTETIATRGFQNVREDLAEVIRYLETLRAFLTAAEAGTEITRAGLALPAPRVLEIGHMHAVEHFPKLLQKVVELSGHSLLMAPGEEDLESPEVRADLERHFGDGNLEDRAKLFRLAWDMACSGFAGRQLLFETFNARSLVQNRLALFDRYDLTPYEDAVRRLAGMSPAERPEGAARGPAGRGGGRPEAPRPEKSGSRPMEVSAS